jgi:aryl-alcohol dehydrogenase-like predicted oxidoreductase
MTWGYQNSEREAHEQLDYTLSTWVNFIDTAEMYAVPPDPKTCYLTESYIGNWIEKRGNRSDFILASKITGSQKNNHGILHVRDGRGITGQEISLALEGSLKRLKTDYIDLYQLHWPQRKVPIRWRLNFNESMTEDKDEVEENIFEVLTTLKFQIDVGKIRYIGLSNETPWGVMKFLEIARKYNLPEIQTVQNAYNLNRRDYESGLAEISTYEGVGLLAYSPLAGWILSGKYLNDQMPEGARYTLYGKARMPQNFNHRTLKATENYQKIAKKLWISQAQLAIAWVSDRDFVHSNIIGATTMKQLKEDIDSANIILSKEVRDEIDNIFSQAPNPACY